MNNTYKCPLCANVLTHKNLSYICEKNHCFDIAKEGYVNLLPVQHKKSKNPGDNSDMIQSRRRFLSAGYYDGAIDKIAGGILSTTPPKQTRSILDIGCGEGYYLSKIAKHMSDSHMSGIDISKPAIKLAAKHLNTTKFAVGSAFALPYFDDTFDTAISVFSPLDITEAIRVLKPNGMLAVAGPAMEHLQQLAAHVYEEQQPHKGHGLALDKQANLEQLSQDVYSETLCVQQEHILDLLRMTPYFWSCSETSKQKLKHLPQLITDIAFDIQIYRVCK